MKPTLPYLIPLLAICATALVLIVLIVCRKIRDTDKIEINDNNLQKACFYISIFVVLVLGLGLLATGILNVLATYVASKQLEYLNCVATEKLNGFYSGSGDTWMGSNNLPTNVSSLRVSFINNIKQLRNGLKGFTTNLSLLGVPVNVVYPTMKDNLQANFFKWLTMNTSVSATIKVPICQMTPYTVPDPTDNAKTVSFPFMTTVCNGLTTEGVALVQNAANLDSLLANYTVLLSNITNINSSLVNLQSTYTSFQTQLNSYNTNNLKVPFLS